MTRAWWSRCLSVVAAFASLARTAAGQSDTLVDPPSIRSQNGVLRTTFAVVPSTATVAGRTFQTNLYNGLYVPPTLRLQRGDSLELVLRNMSSSTQSTNLHYHGMTVSPQAGADDVFVHIPVASTYAYQFRVPPSHSQGMYWYHPHAHGFSEAQVLGGLSGALIVDGILENNYPELVGIRERVLLLKDIRFPGDSGSLPKTKTINGQLNPTINIRPGEYQFWRIGNVGADSYMNISLGGLPFWVIAIDGNLTGCVTLNRWRTEQVCPVPTTQYLLPPSSRVEIVVLGPAPGSYALWSDSVDTGPDGDPNPAVQLGTLVSGGGSVATQSRMRAIRAMLLRSRATKAANTRPSPEALRQSVVTRRDTLVYTEDTTTNFFYINGKTFDPARDDTYAKVGDVIEFTIINRTRELHTFHIHQTDYLVTEVNGQPSNAVSYQDNVNVPYMVNDTPGVVKVLVPFFEPVAVGKFVYHCHILEHEDRGMMATMVLLPMDAQRSTPESPRMAPTAPQATSVRKHHP